MKYRKVISLKYSEAVCIIQDGCTGNGVEKEIGWFKKNKYLLEKNEISV